MQTTCAQASTSPTTPATHRVIELFAGVGGFHFGLEQVNQQRQAQGLPRAFDVVYANQWEPKGKHQHAARVYEARFGLAPVCRDLMQVLDDSAEMARIDALAPDTMMAGFPCQDYSVAKPSSKSEGIVGKKGVLWWCIHRMLQARIATDKPIQQVLLENVDRLISSPSACPGRDFAIILSSLQSLGYGVSWQVVNSGEYGFAQRRKRVFVVAVHQSTEQFQRLKQAATGDLSGLLVDATPLAQALPVQLAHAVTSFELGGDVFAAQEAYQAAAGGKSQFANTGVCIDGRVYTGKVHALELQDCTPFTGHSLPLTLGDVVAETRDVPESFYIPDAAIPQWEYAKGAKSVPRVSATGFAYNFTEGAMAFPDALDKPSRTIITSEGGTSVARTKHVVRDADGRLRRLTPEELEVLSGFPRGFTRLDGVNDIARAKLMGNSLITGVVARIAEAMLAPPRLNPIGAIVHTFKETLHIEDGISIGDWTFTLNQFNDLTCNLRFDVQLAGHVMPTIMFSFESRDDLRDRVGIELGTTRIPSRVLAAIYAAVPIFIKEAALVYPAHDQQTSPSAVT